MAGLEAPLARSFYARPADVLARALLGCALVVRSEDAIRAGRVVETEAYLGEEDLASHASKGRTRRTATLYGPPGTSYVYLIYGMYDLFNVVALREGTPHAVLIRAVEPITPLDRRSDGPGRLTRALGITLRHNGLDLTSGPVTLHPGEPPTRVAVAARVGVDYAGAWSTAPLRFYDPDSAHLSRRASP